MDNIVLSVTDFVGLLNQTLEIAYPSVIIEGELANFRVSKNRWVYFDLKDEYSSVKFFGTVYQLPGPLEDGLMLQVRGNPKLHPLYGFSVTVQSMQPKGEGSIKRAAALLEKKLATEGLFEESRKRPLPYPPKKIGLIASGESAAYRDFIKILNARWSGLDIQLADVQVQGERAPAQIIAAIEYFNQQAEPVDVLVATRGGGSPEDLATFSTEQVTRAIAASRIPTLVAIGHEVDVSLAELAADRRASTPSNAAELLVPDKRHVSERLQQIAAEMPLSVQARIRQARDALLRADDVINNTWRSLISTEQHDLVLKRQVLRAFDPTAALQRGYAIVRHNDLVVRSGRKLKTGDNITLQLSDAVIDSKVTKIDLQ